VRKKDGIFCTSSAAADGKSWKSYPIFHMFNFEDFSYNIIIMRNLQNVQKLEKSLYVMKEK
jgi:hypothetical protein